MVEVKPASKPRKRIKNTDLPAEILDDGAWQEIILPTLMFWAGFQQDPWVVNEELLRDALLIIGRNMVGLTYQLTMQGRTTVEVARVSQFISVIKNILNVQRPLNDFAMAGGPFLVPRLCMPFIYSSKKMVSIPTTIG